MVHSIDPIHIRTYTRTLNTIPIRNIIIAYRCIACALYVLRKVLELVRQKMGIFYSGHHP